MHYFIHVILYTLFYTLFYILILYTLFYMCYKKIKLVFLSLCDDDDDLGLMIRF